MLARAADVEHRGLLYTVEVNELACPTPSRDDGKECAEGKAEGTLGR
jgi:hypothetical protein